MKIALRGSLASGKTTIAKILVEQHGLTLVNFTDYLKQLYVDHTNSMGLEQFGVDYQPLTVEEVKANKELYRPDLIQHGHDIGFDDDPKYTRDAVFDAGSPVSAVFDNVRYPAQMRALDVLGYTLVRLWAPRELLALRQVVYKGMKLEEAYALLDAPVEHAMDSYEFPHEIEVGNYDRDPAETAQQIVDQLVWRSALRTHDPRKTA